MAQLEHIRKILVVYPLNTAIKSSLLPSPLTIAIIPKNSSKDNQIERTDEEIIKLLNWMEDHLDMLHQPSRWSRLCKLEDFGQNENIMVERIKDKSTNMKKTFSKLHNGFQNKTGSGVMEGDCNATAIGKCQSLPQAGCHRC